MTNHATVANGVVVTASHVAPNANEGVEQAVDGDVGTGWFSTGLNPATDPRWFQLDFGGTRKVCKVIATWATNLRAASYRIETSVDGSVGTWTSVSDATIGVAGTYLGVAVGQKDETVFTTPVSTRYLRYYLTEAVAGGYGYKLTETAVYGPAPEASPPPSPPPSVPSSCLASTVRVNAPTGGVYRLNGIREDVAYGAAEYVFEIDSDHPLRLDGPSGAICVQWTSLPASTEIPTGSITSSANTIDTNRYYEGRWLVRTSSAPECRGLSLKCGYHGAMDGTDRMVYDHTCSTIPMPPAVLSPPPPHPSPLPSPPPNLDMCTASTDDVLYSSSAVISASSMNQNVELVRTNPGTRWNTETSNSGEYLIFDFGAQVPVCTVYVSWEAASAYEYHIRTRDSVSEPWVVRTTYIITDHVPDHPGVGKRTEAHSETNVMPFGLKARYVQIYMVSAVSGYPYSVWLVEIKGAMAPPAPPSPPSPFPPPLPPTPPPANFYDPVAGECIVGTGQEESVFGLVDHCTTMTIQGTLRVLSNTRIETRRIVVEEGGSMLIGTEAEPATGVTLHLDHDDCDHLVTNRMTWMTDNNQAAAASCLESGELRVYGTFKAYGVPRTSWTQLTADCFDATGCTATTLDTLTIRQTPLAGCGCATIEVEECDGWEVDDRIVVAYNLGRFPAGAPLQLSPTRTIASITRNGRACSIGLNESTPLPHIGPTNPYLQATYTSGATLSVGAEVANFERSIVFTGPRHWRYAPGTIDGDNERFGAQGWVSAAFRQGVYDVNYVRYENCGRVLLGEYCIHAHWKATSGIHVNGIATNATNGKVVTIHSTSDSVVENSVMFNHRGAMIYFENGAEHDNLIQGNFIACEQPSHSEAGKCGLVGGVSGQADADLGEQSAIYGLSAGSANIVGNRIVGGDNAHFWNQGGKMTGQDRALGKVAAKATQGGRFEYNVIHDVFGFSWYSNLHAPMQLELNSNGYIEDWAKACMYSVDGTDNSGSYAANHNFEYHSNFAFGGYMSLQLSMQNYTSLNSLKSTYLKTFYRSIGTPPYVDGGVWRDTGNTAPELPGGHGLVELKDVVFERQYIQLNHHCRLNSQPTGGMCSSIYWIHGSGGSYSNSLQFWDEALENFGSPTIEWDDIPATLFKDTPATGRGPAPMFDISSCTSQVHTVPGRTPQTYHYCSQDWGIRPVVIYSPNRGPIRVRDTTPGHQTAEQQVLYSWLVSDHDSQITDYAPVGRQSSNGYTFLIRNGAEVTITIDGAAAEADRNDLFAIDYSQPTFPFEKKTSFTLTVTGANAAADGLAGGPYTISSDHSRAFMTPFGAMTSAAGAWYEAMNTNGAAGTWRSGSNFLTPAAFEDERVQFVRGFTPWRS